MCTPFCEDHYTNQKANGIKGARYEVVNGRLRNYQRGPRAAEFGFSSWYEEGYGLTVWQKRKLLWLVMDRGLSVQDARQRALHYPK